MAASSTWWGSDLQYWWWSYCASLQVPGDSSMGSILSLLPQLPMVLWKLGNIGSKRLIKTQIHDTVPWGCNSRSGGRCGDAAVCGVTQASLRNPPPAFCNGAQQTHRSRHAGLWSGTSAHHGWLEVHLSPQEKLTKQILFHYLLDSW